MSTRWQDLQTAAETALVEMSDRVAVAIADLIVDDLRARGYELPTAMAPARAAVDGLPYAEGTSPRGGSPASPAVEHLPESRNTADSPLRPGT